jgi:HSP20 family protein
LDPSWSGDLDEESNRLENTMDEMNGPDGNQSGERHMPLVDVIEEEREVVVVVELPGIKKEDVQIRATKGNVTISVDTVEFKYHKGLALPVETNPGSAVATYKNGVLQIRLKKLPATQPFTI